MYRLAGSALFTANLEPRTRAPCQARPDVLLKADTTRALSAMGSQVKVYIECVRGLILTTVTAHQLLSLDTCSGLRQRFSPSDLEPLHLRSGVSGKLISKRLAQATPARCAARVELKRKSCQPATRPPASAAMLVAGVGEALLKDEPSSWACADSGPPSGTYLGK